jgi:vacuolar-type H+-ATPase subunit C/Vma6
LDLLLNTTFAKLAARAIRRAPLGNAARRDLRAWIHGIIDIENAFTALQLAGQHVSLDPMQFFVPGGRAVDRLAFASAIAGGNIGAAISILERALRATAYAPVFKSLGTQPIEDVALAAELRGAKAAARRSPLGAAPLIAFLTRLRAEVRDVRGIIWRVALGAPADASEMVTIA